MRKYIEDTNPASEFLIEPMFSGDLAEVVEVEQITGLSPWGFAAYQRELMDNPRAIMLVAKPLSAEVADRSVLGFLCSNLVLDEWHINNLATHPDYQRRGVAWELMQRGSALARSGGARFGLLEVRASNYVAQILYIKMGFRIVARRRCYYGSPAEDAIVLRLELTERSWQAPT